MIINSDSVTTAQIRQLLRDPANREDDLLVGLSLAVGAISPFYAQSTPSACLQIEGPFPTAKYGTGKLGAYGRPKMRYREDIKQKRIVPDPQYNPLRATKTSNGMKLGKGMPLSMFSFSNLSKLSATEAREFSKYAYLHSLILNGIRANTDRFSKYSIELVECLYYPEENQTVTPGSRLDLMRSGRVAVFEVKSKEGSDTSATFEVARYIKDNALFEELILSYDTLDPNQRCTGQIIVIMPEVDDFYKGDFRRKVCTEYNFNSALREGLAELTV